MDLQVRKFKNKLYISTQNNSLENFRIARPNLSKLLNKFIENKTKIRYLSYGCKITLRGQKGYFVDHQILWLERSQNLVQQK